jgi:hypothetical protein
LRWRKTGKLKGGDKNVFARVQGRRIPEKAPFNRNFESITAKNVPER